MDVLHRTSLHATEQMLFFTLLQLAVIVLAARAGGALARRVGQAAVVGEIVVGLLLGPSCFGLLAPEAFAAVFRAVPPEPMTLLSQVGLLLVMFQIGLEFDFAHLRERRNRAVVAAVSVAGLLAPFALGCAFGLLAPERYAPQGARLGFALFVGTAFSITALPVLGRIMIELGMTRSRLGAIAIGAAAVSDVAGWLLLAAVTALGASAFAAGPFALKAAGVLGFVAAAWWGLRPLLERFVRGRMDAAGGALTPLVMGVVLATVFLGGMATFQLGIFAIFGGFLAGVLLHRDTRFAQAWSERAGGFVDVFFLPVFFTLTGLRTDIGSLSGSAWGWCALLIALATLGKFGAGWVAARWAGLGPLEARIVAVMINTRGLMELVVVNVGHELGLIGPEVFSMLVLMAIASTVVTTPALRRWLPALQQPAAAPARPHAGRAAGGA